VIAPSGLARSRWLGRRYLVELGGIRLPSYTTMLYLGIVVGLYVGALVAGAEGLSRGRFVVASLVLLAPALAGARLLYVAQHATFYRAHPELVWRRSDGGSSVYGGLLLSLAVSVPVLALLGLPFWSYWDAAILTMLVGLVVTRIGCLLHGCCVGRETDGWIGMWLPDHHGVWLRRYPSQLLEAAWALVVLAAALAARPSLPFAGALLAFVVGAYAAGRLLLEPTRESADPKRTIWVNVALSAALLVGAVALLALGRS
jgi:prolipoprotein diacylglyceryltransferase